MESSRWASLIARAATRGLLDVDQGCPLTHRYLLREIWTVRELYRQDQVQMSQLNTLLHASAIQIVTKGPYDEVRYGAYEYALNRALLAYHVVGKLNSPWDEERAKDVERAKERVYDKSNEIEGIGLSDEGIVRMIAELKSAEKEWLARNESRRSKST